MSLTRLFATLVTLVAGVALADTETVTESAMPSPFAGFELVDMTHSFDENTIYWPTEEPFEHEEEFE